MKKRTFLLTIVLVAGGAFSVAADYIQVQNDPIFSEHLKKMNSNNYCISSILVPHTLYDKEKLTKSLAADVDGNTEKISVYGGIEGIPVYYVQHRLQQLSSYKKIEESFTQDFQKFKIEEFVKGNFKKGKIISTSDIPMHKIQLGENAASFMVKGLISYLENDKKREEIIFFEYALIMHVNGHNIIALAFGVAKSAEEIATYENDAQKLYGYLKNNVDSIPIYNIDNNASASEKEITATKNPTINQEDKGTNYVAKKEKNEYYLKPPLGFFRGAATILLSPLNYFRIIPYLPYAYSDAINKEPSSKALGIAVFIFRLPFILSVGTACETIPVVGDIGLGMLDVLSLGAVGNEVYGGEKEYTPWFWERDHQKQWLTK